MKNLIIAFNLICFVVFFATTTSCTSTGTENKSTSDSTKTDTTKVEKRTAIERTKSSNIYEVNIRQYTKEGTFKAFETQIPRLKAMGVDILWVMPINPIGQKNRKGSQGSYYAVKDYKDINPEFGTKEDFKHLVETVHANNMLIIVDWVANHTSWDHTWITKNPEWYSKDSVTGKIIAPVKDWTDVADLNYDNKDMRAAMLDAMKYWITDFNIDGYRCDVANMVPTDFWNMVRPELDKIKPVFMLCEAEQVDLHNVAFDMGYTWKFHHLMNDISKGTKNADSLKEYLSNYSKEYSKDIYKMNFTSNHDENSWNGSEFERMPKSYKTFAVLTYVVPGMPLVYSGQEAGMKKRLKFFEKDPIDWKPFEMTDVYTKLNQLKKENKALWNGQYGGDFKVIETSNSSQIFAISRFLENNTVFSVFNLSDKPAKYSLKDKTISGEFVDYFSKGKIVIEDKTQGTEYTLKPWEYRVFVK